MQGQIELTEPLPKRMQEAFRVPLALEPDDHIIGVAHDDGVAFCSFGPPLAMKPEVEDVVLLLHGVACCRQWHGLGCLDRRRSQCGTLDAAPTLA